jgi:hypothetical protein
VEGSLLAAAALALGILVLAVSLTPLTNNDIFLHMANGEWIMANGRVPLEDPYSFSAGGNRFHAHEWLAGVLFALVHRAGGIDALIFVKTALGALALLLCAWTALREGASRRAALASSGLALAIVNSRFLERPEMFSYALTGFYVLVLALEHRRLADEPAAVPRPWPSRPAALLRSSLLWWLVPFQWAWVQIHGYYLTGLALLILFLAAGLVERIRILGFRRPSAFLSPRLLSGGIAVGIMLLLGLINPNGWEIYTYPFNLAGGRNIFMLTIFEWKPTFTTQSMLISSMFLAFCLWLGLLVVGCLDSPRLLGRHRLWQGLSIAGLGGLLLMRAPLARLKPSAGTGLPASAWLWSPTELLASVAGRPGIRSALDPVLAPLRLIGPWGDDIFTLLWLGLGLAVLLGWRKPAVPGLMVLAATLMFLFHGTREAAPLLLAATVGPALAYALYRKAMPAWHAIFTAAFLVLAVKQNRNIVNFALVTLPVLAPALTRMGRALAEVEARPGRRRAFAARHLRLAGPAGAALLVILYAGLDILTITSGWPYTPAVTKRMGLGVGPRIPVGAVDYISANGIEGQVFNKYAYGAYLIHRLFPSTRVFMDSRNLVYGPVLYKAYLDALRGREAAERVFSSHRFDYVLVDYAFFPRQSEDTGLFEYLAEHDEWVLVYFDDISVLYLRRSPAFDAIIERDGYTLVDPVRYRPGAASRLPPGDLAVYQRETGRALDLRPDAVATRLLRVEYLLAVARDVEALDLLDGVIADEPNNIYALVSAARLARELGRRERALRLYRRAGALRPGLEEVRSERRALEAEMSP